MVLGRVIMGVFSASVATIVSGVLVIGITSAAKTCYRKYIFNKYKPELGQLRRLLKSESFNTEILKNENKTVLARLDLSLNDIDSIDPFVKGVLDTSLFGNLIKQVVFNPRWSLLKDNVSSSNVPKETRDIDQKTMSSLCDIDELLQPLIHASDGNDFANNVNHAVSILQKELHLVRKCFMELDSPVGN